MEIGGFQKFSVIDYPSKISCIVFLKGCNFRCGYCYNKQLVLPELIKEQPTFEQEEVLDFLDKRKNMLDAVVITGGEPTIHGNELVDFIKKIKAKEYLVKLDTNGSNPYILKELINNKLIDYVAMDLKNSFKKYSLFTSTPIEDVKKSLNVLQQSNIQKEFRVVTHPDLKQEDFEEILSYVNGNKIIVQDFVHKNTLSEYKNTQTIFNELDKNNKKYILR